jgi:hypothetical protein
VATRNYLLEFDATRWGWIHLAVGLLVLFAGFAMLSGQTWGRVIGITLAVLSALANFAFVPYYPLSSPARVSASPTRVSASLTESRRPPLLGSTAPADHRRWR